MDSNFSVKITADITELRNRMTAIEQELGKISKSAKTAGDSIKSSFDSAATSTTRVGTEMNRARLATFAFGQVIRDAGFFSQSFGLGVLAISNNIPILIDQLVLLSGVSAGLGSVLSVLGSVLAAGLTVFAYWAQGVERNGGSVSGSINKMVNDSESSIGRLVEYLNNPPASEILGKMVDGIQESISLIEQIIGAAVDFSIAVWDRFGTDISKVFSIFYGIVYNTMNNVLNIFRFAASVVKGDFAGAFKALGNIAKNVINNIIGLIQVFVKTSSTLLGTFVSTFDPLKGAIIKAAGEQLVQFGDGLKFASESADSASFSFKDFLSTLFSGKKEIKDTKKAIDDLNKSVRQPALPKGAYVKEQFERPIWMAPKGMEVKKVDLVKPKFPPGSLEAEQLKEMVLNLIELEKQIDDVLVNGIANTIGEAMMAIGEAFAMGGDIGKAFGNALLRSLASVLSQFGDMLIAASLAGLSFSNAFKNLFDPKNWALALAAGVALKIAAGGLAGFTRNASSGSRGANVASAASGMGGSLDNRGMGPIYTRSTISNIGLSSQANPVLETRVSGNDLVILMKRADKNRNGYY